MTLQLSISAFQPSTTTLQGFAFRVELFSTAAAPMILPTPEDQSGALAIEVRDALGTVLRTMSGMTHQVRMTTARRDSRPVLGKLNPGERWVWQLDVCILHSPLPAGDLDLFARYVYAEADVSLTAGPLAVRVEDLGVRSLSTVRDNCVLDGLSCLLIGEPLLLQAPGHADSSDDLDAESVPRLTRPAGDFGQTSADSTDSHGLVQSKHVMRLYNTMRPLASWYSIAPELPPDAQDVCCATNAFFLTASFDPYYSRWLLYREGSSLHARHYEVGIASGDVREMAIPEGREFLRTAYVDEDGSLHALFQGEGDLLESYRVDGNQSRLDFGHQLDLARASTATLGVDRVHIHSIVGGRELRYDRLSRTGELLDRRTLFRSRLGPYSCRIDTVRRAAEAIFWDGPSGRTIHMVHISLATGEVAERTMTLDVRGDLAELAAARDRDGRWHLAVAVETGSLLYWRDDSGPRVVHDVELPCFPFVVAEQHSYVGLTRPGLGWGFVELRGMQVVEDE